MHETKTSESLGSLDTTPTRLQFLSWGYENLKFHNYWGTKFWVCFVGIYLIQTYSI